MSKSKISNKSKVLKRGLLIIISAPSGCGKTTIVDRLLKRHPDWVPSVSVTTRAPREGEKEGVDYFFVSPSTFEAMKAKEDFLEFATVFDSAYGTPKEYVLERLEENKPVVLTIDVQGMKKVKKSVGGQIPMMSVFILPPSLKVLRERLEGRKTEVQQEIQMRIEIAQEEIKQAKLYDYTVVNKNLDQTILEVDELVTKYQKERG